MLVFFDIRQDSGFFTELVEATKGSFKRFVVADLNSGQSVTPPLNGIGVLEIIVLIYISLIISVRY